MIEDEFWSIIEASRVNAGGERELQAEALHALLAEMPLEAIESFNARFWHAMGRSYRWKLHGAAYLILGGGSSDGFDYFRFWLISMGRAHFEAALADADNLADIDLLPDDDDAEWESLAQDFGYVAGRVWAEKSGKDLDEMPSDSAAFAEGRAGEVPIEAEKQGTSWDDEDPAYMAKTYPRLWEKFGAMLVRSRPANSTGKC